MAENKGEIIDSQIIAEHVGFLDNCFDNSFTLQSSLLAVKEYVAEENNELSTTKSRGAKLCQKINASTLNNTVALNSSTYKNATILSQLNENDKVAGKSLKDWGLPQEIARKYEQRGITEMFDWQVSCLGNPKVLMDCCNLVYSAPTSAGKTLVAEILTVKTILERQKKAIIILPFVSIVREKMFYLQDILSSSGIRVEGFMGSQSPPGGLQSVHVAICTIEKANSLVNKLLDEGNISELGAVIVDELHLLGDPHRGYILELLLTKIKYISSRLDSVQIQIVGMSATLPNLEVLANWLGAELFITQFRPIPLDEFCLVGNRLYDKHGKCVNSITNSKAAVDDGDNVLKICLQTIKDGCSILIFCMTKNRCENLAQSIASSFFKLGCTGDEMGLILRKQLNSEMITEVLEQLKSCPVNLDQVLKKTISFGVAYHHAGLTFDERDIIEGGFKSGAIRVLVATSTLSSGVNLPARKVIIRSPVFQRQPINILTYKQMIGRAGRMGKDTKGESILICTETEKKIGFDLMMGALDPVKSCIETEDKYMRAALEMIASQVACTKEELDLYSKCTLLFTQQNVTPSQDSLLENTLEELKNYELVRIQINGDETHYVATPLGKACLSSSMAPNDGLSLFCELQKARQCLVLETDLHLIYLVTPYSVSSQWGEIDWLHLLTLWESLTKAMKRVGELVGVQESFIICCLRGTNKLNNAQNKLNIHKRFYTALALQDLVNEVPLSEVAAKFQCARGFLQSLQQAAATFAGMVTTFCHQLGWKNMEMLISQFQDRLHFGVHCELLELMKLPSLNGMRARTLFDAGFETISSIASADANLIENTLHKAVPFQSEKEREGDDKDDIRKRNKIKNIWITGCCGMTTKEAAENLIAEARKYLEFEIGVSEIKWKSVPSNSLKNELKTTTERGKNIDEVDEIYTSKNMMQCQIKTENITVKVESVVEEESKITLGATPAKGSDCEDINLSANICKSNFEINDNFKKSLKDNVSGHCSNFTPKHKDVLEPEETESTVVINNLSGSIDDSPVVINNSPIITNDVSVRNNNHVNCKNTKNEISEMKYPLSSKGTLECSPSILKHEMWETMNFTETAFENITKKRISDGLFSPNISFGDSEKTMKNGTSSKSMSVKDVSLFSSEGDNSSLFEESLPLDLIPSKLLDDKNETTQTSKINKQETVSDFVSLNSNSILNEFKTVLVGTDDEEDDMKLVYDDDDDDENKRTENELEAGLNLSEDIEVVETQVINETVKKDFKSPYKRHAEFNIKNSLQPSVKKSKRGMKFSLVQKRTTQMNGLSNGLKLNSKDSKIFTLEVKSQRLKCFVVRGTDLTDIFFMIENIEEAAIYLDVTTNMVPSSHEIIGSNIIQCSMSTKNTKDVNDTIPFIMGLAIYFGQETCIFLDFTSLKDNFLAMKSRLSNWLQRKSLNLKMMSLKYNYVYIKKSFDIDLPTSCVDICLAEWLMDSDEKIPNIFHLTKKYCNIDLLTAPLKIDDHGKKFKYFDAIENVCIRAWAVWEIAENQAKCLSDQKFGNSINIEIQVSKILGNCEYYGITVDKDLASKLLIDVKNSQEILRKKAYKICGYHFNFNSSKDVAKVLGIYKGRKVSTKKSVLTSHDSPMASIVIFWRKLNSILTKTLYPLTEKACIYSAGNRISPSYTMYTATGRISMHEPNLQNVPRTFSIPANYLSESESTDVVEFNCRNIFKATAGYVLVSADYCQLEMRILTHYSGDEVLTKIMSSNEDVFKSIAASWGNVPEDEVDDDLRQKAKQLCYGILYGMGNRTLSQHLDVTEMEAAVFMETFYKTYPAIKFFTQSVVEECRRKGYVETLMKRRRYLPDINSVIPSRRSTAERQAVNTTIQGSAADIAKAAMCGIETRTKNDFAKPRLILQMHDELIYEVPETNKHTFIRLLKEVMEETVRLKVPLPVKVRYGFTWGTLEEIKF